MLRAVLGNPGPDYTGTAAGRGVLLRLLMGHQIDEMFADSAVADAIEHAAPVPGGCGCSGPRLGYVGAKPL